MALFCPLLRSKPAQAIFGEKSRLGSMTSGQNAKSLLTAIVVIGF
jgi:hypothetical protein